MKIGAMGTRGAAAGLLGLAMLGSCGMVARAQRAGQPQAGTPQQSGNVPTNDPFADDKLKGERSPFADQEAKQAKLREDERQKRLVADSDKLLALAKQLHEEVGKTDKHILSVDVVRRAEEIERLAHNVKERMKG